MTAAERPERSKIPTIPSPGLRKLRSEVLLAAPIFTIAYYTLLLMALFL